jgi:hypothetical protein
MYDQLNSYSPDCWRPGVVATRSSSSRGPASRVDLRAERALGDHRISAGTIRDPWHPHRPYVIESGLYGLYSIEIVVN